MRAAIPLCLLALLGTGAVPAPAAAQTVTSICAANTLPLNVTRTRFHYDDWQGRSYTSAWVSLAVAQRNCVRLQDVSRVTVEFDLLGTFLSWEDLCRQPVQATGRAVEVVAYAVGSQYRCAVR